MTNKTPLHGGSLRVAFDGGTNIRKSLPFRAIAVNIDNWSPYWYKLNPIEEYIPPFQNGVNIRLPLLTDFEFVCQAPPGIEQAIIIATTGIAGNTRPVIALFSSFDTNNDAGNSALVQAANVTVPSTDVSGFGQVILPSIDLTLYNGAYVLIRNDHADAILVVFNFLPTPLTPISQYTLYLNEEILFTIPKLGQLLRITITSTTGGVIDAGYSVRSFLGYADYAATTISNSFFSASLGDARTIINDDTVTFVVNGIDNAVITVWPDSVNGPASGDTFWVRVTMASYAHTLGNILLYTKAFSYGFGGVGLVIPINNLLARQANSISVQIVSSNVNLISHINLHHIPVPADTYDYLVPPPLHSIVPTAVIATGLNIFATLATGGRLIGVRLAVLAASVTVASFIAVYAGTAIGVQVPLGVAPATVVGSYMFNDFRPIPFDTGYSSIWTNTNSVAGLNVGIVTYLD